MSRCVGCEFARHDQFKGYCGRWMCFHPYRKEISNRGNFIYPANSKPDITICKTAVSDYNNLVKQTETLASVKTPAWCYYEVVERARKTQPGFDPDVQRTILWPLKGSDVTDKQAPGRETQHLF